MATKQERQELINAIAEVQSHPLGTRRYGSQLKRQIVDYVSKRMADGLPRRAIAKELNVADSQLGRWIRQSQRRAKAGDDSPGTSRSPSQDDERLPIIVLAHVHNVRLDGLSRRTLRLMLEDDDVSEESDSQEV